jgi:hypothetical protein
MRPPNGKRGRSRGRSKGGSGHHHHNHHNNVNRTLESNGPDVKIRGTAVHIHEKYLALARDAHSSGDRVSAENYLQHAEHYHRLLASMAPPGQPYQPGQQGGMNGSSSEGDDEGAPGQGGQAGSYQGGYQQNQGGYQNQDGNPNFGGGNSTPQGGNPGSNTQGSGEREAPREGRDFRGREPRENRDARPEGQVRENREPRETQSREPRENREPRAAIAPAQVRADQAPPVQPRTDGEQALAFDRRLNGRSRRVSTEDRNGRAITSLEREEAARAKPANPPEPAADEGDDEAAV